MGELIPFPSPAPPEPTPREAAEQLVRDAAAWIAADYANGRLSGPAAAAIFGAVAVIAALVVKSAAPSRAAAAAGCAGVLQVAINATHQVLGKVDHADP